MTQRTSKILDDAWITPSLIEYSPDSPPPPIKGELLSDDLIGSSPDGTPPPFPPVPPPIENELFPDDLISSSRVVVDLEIDPGIWWREISVLSHGQLKEIPKLPGSLAFTGGESFQTHNFYNVNLVRFEDYV
jgi:hypothetical protein